MFEGQQALGIDIKKKTEGTFLITLKGRVDSDTYRQLDVKVKPLLIPSTKVIILDMEKVSYVSSAGLGVIFDMKNFIEKNNGSLVISSLQPHVKKVFEIVKALPPENIFESREELDKYLDNIQRKEIEKGKGT